MLAYRSASKLTRWTKSRKTLVLISCGLGIIIVGYSCPSHHYRSSKLSLMCSYTLYLLKLALWMRSNLLTVMSNSDILAGFLKSVWHSCSQCRMQTTLSEPIIISLSPEYNTSHPGVNTLTDSPTSAQIPHDPLEHEPQIAFHKENLQTTLSCGYVSSFFLLDVLEFLYFAVTSIPYLNNFWGLSWTNGPVCSVM